MLEAIAAFGIWALVAHGLWKLSQTTISEGRDEKVTAILCVLWPITIPLAILIVVFRRS